MEKALTGLDPSREGFVRGRVSVVAPMQEHEVAAKAIPTFVSGLDAVVVLDADRGRIEDAWRGVEAFAASAEAQRQPLRCVHVARDTEVKLMRTFVFAHRERGPA